nr:hypothetical protein [Tanacetum cinerariifolium]
MDKENPWGNDGTGKDVELHLYRSMIRSLMYLTISRPDIMFVVCACARHQVTPKSVIFMLLREFLDNDSGGANQDRKSTTGVRDTMKYSDKSPDKGSDSIDEMANVLGTMGALNILSSGGLKSVFTTVSLLVATVSIGVSPAVVTASGSFPTTPSKGKVLEQMSVQLGRDLEAKFAQEDQIIREQAERDSEIAMIHAIRELKMIITELDRSNEMISKHLAQIKKYQAQQNKPATKTENRNFYMLILRSNAGWKAKDFKGMTFVKIEEKFIPVWEKMQDFMSMNSKLESKRLKRLGIQLDKECFKKLKTAKASGTEPTQEQQSKEPKELSEEELKKMIEEDLDKLWSLVKETCNTTEVTDEKAKEIWVELKRLYKPDSRDPL